MQTSVVVVAILLVAGVLIMYHIWTNKDVKKCTPGGNENLERMYLEDMMGKKEKFMFNRKGNKYYFRRATPKWDEDEENVLNMQLAEGRTFDCVADNGRDMCADTQFFSVHKKVNVDITEQECEELHKMFNTWSNSAGPRVTFPENAPKGGTCIGQKSRWRNIEFLWSKNS